MANFEDKMSRAAAQSLFSSLNSLQSNHFKGDPIPDDIINIMATLNLNQQHFMIERAPYFIYTALDSSALERQLKELDKIAAERELEDNFLLHGAPLVLMRRLFGMHASEFSRRRNALNIRNAGTGRPPICDEHTEHLVWSLWNENQSYEERQRFIIIAEKTGLDLHVIWSALREHIAA